MYKETNPAKEQPHPRRYCPPLGKKKKKRPVLGDFVAPRIQGDLRSGQRLFSEISALKVDEIGSSVHQTRQRCQGLILGFVALWVQVRNRCYSAKVSENLFWPQLYWDIRGRAREAVPLQPIPALGVFIFAYRNIVHPKSSSPEASGGSSDHDYHLSTGSW